MLRGVARLQRLVMTRGMLLRGFAPKVNFSPLGVRPAHRRLCAAGCSRRATAEHLHPWRGSINHKSLRTSAVRQDIEAHVDDAADSSQTLARNSLKRSGYTILFALATRSWYASAAVLTPWLYYISSRIFRKSGDSTCTCCTSTMGDVKSPARSEPSSRSWRSDWAQQHTFAPPRGRSPTPTSRPARGLGVEVRHKSCSRVWARMSSCRVITPTTKQRQSCSSSCGGATFQTSQV